MEYLYEIKKHLLIALLLMFGSNWITFADLNMLNGKKQSNEAEVRAILLNCNEDIAPNVYELKTRNLWHHDVSKQLNLIAGEDMYDYKQIKNCKKKIFMNVKLFANGNDEKEQYIPVTHVYDPITKRQAMLLNPYVLKVSQAPLLQAYDLSFLQTIEGESKYPNVDPYPPVSPRRKFYGKSRRTINHRRRKVRNVEDSDGQKSQITYDRHYKRNIFNNSSSVKETTGKSSKYQDMAQYPADIGLKIEAAQMSNTSCGVRVKYKLHPPQNVTPSDGEESRQARRLLYDSPLNFEYRDENRNTMNHRDDHKVRGFAADDDRSKYLTMGLSSADIDINNYTITDDEFFLLMNPMTTKATTKPARANNKDINDDLIRIDKSSVQGRPINTADSNVIFNMYRIGEPRMLYNAHVELFEKYTSDKGNTIWRDLTGGKPYMIGTFRPEASGGISGDISIRYNARDRPVDQDFDLPSRNELFLLIPHHVAGNINEDFSGNPGEYLVVSTEIAGRGKKWCGSETSKICLLKAPLQLWREDKMAESAGRQGVSFLKYWGEVPELPILKSIDKHYLTLKSQGTHEAQLKLEARADENEVVRVGTSGRISSVVVDSTRPRLTRVSVSASNTGLASSPFKILLNDCSPTLNSISQGQHLTIAPKHTKSYEIEIAAPLPDEEVHCSVSMLNGRDELVALRRIRMKRFDRCFCIWNCLCACLGSLPTLHCANLPADHLAAAGFESEDIIERRSCTSHDTFILDVLVILAGLLLFLLALGILKGLLGLFCACIGFWGLERLVELPRKLPHYYESKLRHRKVVYDSNGWPVHPDTCRKTVQVMCSSTQFCLNTVFFLTFPCAVTWCVLRIFCSSCCPCWVDQYMPAPPCYTWNQRVSMERDRASFPAKDTDRQKLLGNSDNNPVGDYEAMIDERDTQYVMMHLKKSKEALARSQVSKSNSSGDRQCSGRPAQVKETRQ